MCQSADPSHETHCELAAALAKTDLDFPQRPQRKERMLKRRDALDSDFTLRRQVRCSDYDTIRALAFQGAKMSTIDYPWRSRAHRTHRRH